LGCAGAADRQANDRANADATMAYCSCPAVDYAKGLDISAPIAKLDHFIEIFGGLLGPYVKAILATASVPGFSWVNKVVATLALRRIGRDAA